MAGRHHTARTVMRRRIGYAAALLVLAGGSFTGARELTTVLTHQETAATGAAADGPDTDRTGARAGRGTLRGLPTATPRPTISLPPPVQPAVGTGAPQAPTSSGVTNPRGTGPTPATNGMTGGTATGGTATAGAAPTTSSSPTTTSSPSVASSPSPTASTSPSPSTSPTCARARCQ